VTNTIMDLDVNDTQAVLIPLKLDAFVFNGPVCDGKVANSKSSEGEAVQDQSPTAAKIAPITQPNYTFLRLDRDFIQPDIQDPIDLSNSWPSEFNPRYTDLGSDRVRERRRGVYLHWTMPRLYRSGIAAAGSEAGKSAIFEEGRAARGFYADGSSNGGDGKDNNVDASAPAFPTVPTRWLVVRYITDMTTIEPAEACSQVKQFTAWVVESDRLRKIDDLDAEVDLQVDVSPFISAKDDSVSVADQAEVFIGYKERVETWSEKLGKPPPPPIPPSRPGGKPTQPKKAEFVKNFSLFASSNQLFPDYQPHNSNVFSMVDNFEYGSNNFLTSATASYYIVGWHSDEQDDLFTGPTLGGKDRLLSRQKRLDMLKLKIKMPEGKRAEEEFADWLTATKPARIICHGAMYQVRWDLNNKPTNVPADEFCTMLNDTLPLAIGTTPLDALTTYARAHADSDKEGSTTRKLADYITQLERHLLARDDGVEAQQQASDLLYNWNYLRADGGQEWHSAGGDERNGKNRPTAPPEMLSTLRHLNIVQQLLDGVMRTLTRLRWELFAEWWNVVSDPSREAETEGRVRELQKRILELIGRRNTCMDEIKEKAGADEKSRTVQPGAQPAFYQQRDPTLLVGGIRSGWQHDYLDNLLVRLESQTVKATSTPSTVPTVAADPTWDGFESKVKAKLPTPVQPAIHRLVTEFIRLRPEAEKEPDLSGNAQLPLFHDTIAYRDPDTNRVQHGPWRDRWEKTQPWFPLFLEWEVEYHHIPVELWSLTPRRSRTLKTERLRYGIDSNTDLEEELEKLKPDKRKIQGRVLILPQPSFSLEAKIRQLFASTPSLELDKNKDGSGGLLDEEKRNELLRDLHQLAFLSAPLAGLTGHLTTVLQGNHIKPNLRDGKTGAVFPIKEAMRPKSGFGKDQLQSIDIETDNTPFGNAVKPSTNDHPLFKPATHGQFRFTKLNIIDKFGQAIHPIDPQPSMNPQKVWPCIGEWYAPQLFGDQVNGEPNVVERPQKKDDANKGSKKDDEREEHPKPCEWMQVPPQINQQARLNATFVMRDDKVDSIRDDPKRKVTPFWRPADEWENPIWGWVVINYANLGIQIFLQNGTFYREVRLAGRTGAQRLPEWLPFEPPAKDDTKLQMPEMRQLQLLVQRLGDDVEFLRAFWDMIDRSTGSMDASPDAYAAFPNALIGRPLALTHIGWSLELATDALTSYAQGDEERQLPVGLLPDTGKKQYEFSVKIGDSQRGFDGLVGYFACRGDLTSGKTTDLGLNLDTLWTDFTPPPAESPGEKRKKVHLSKEENQFGVAPSKPIQLHAYYESPEPQDVPDADEYIRRRNDRLQVYGVLTDPFASVHAYSGILPVRELALPPWTWQAAMSKMKAFFHAGPVMVTRDVPNFVPSRVLEPSKPVTLPKVDHDKGSVGLPAMPSGDWTWLQPYYPEQLQEKGEGHTGNPPAVEKPLERFMALPIKADDERARYDAGPYTVLEGYLMMVGPPETKK
jgi:hypothetical protein